MQLLPSQAQVNTAGRYSLAIAGTAISIFGLQAKGISLDQVKLIIAALGDAINNIVILVSAIGVLYASIKGVTNSSGSGQAAALGGNAATIVQAAPGGTATVTITDPAMAAAALDAQKKAA
jgi:hypothetical protein